MLLEWKPGRLEEGIHICKNRHREEKLAYISPSWRHIGADLLPDGVVCPNVLMQHSVLKPSEMKL